MTPKERELLTAVAGVADVVVRMLERHATKRQEVARQMFGGESGRIDEEVEALRGAMADLRRASEAFGAERTETIETELRPHNEQLQAAIAQGAKGAAPSPATVALADRYVAILTENVEQERDIRRLRAVAAEAPEEDG